MLDWLRKLFGADNAALDRRDQQRRSRKRSKQMRAREQELRRQNQKQELKGGKRRTPFFWGSPGVTTPCTRLFEKILLSAPESSFTGMHHDNIQSYSAAMEEGLVNKTAAALQAGTTAGLRLRDLVQQEVFQKQFPAIQRQISNLQTAFITAENEFTQDARRLLPKLRDGNTDENAMITELRAAVALFEQRAKLAERFIINKCKEANVLRTTVATLLDSNFENHLGGIKAQSLVGGGVPRLLLSFGGRSIGRAKHPFQAKVESRASKFDTSDAKKEGSESEEDSDDEDEEWFEDQETVTRIQQSCADLRKQRLLTASGVTVAFGVAGIDKAYVMKNEKKKATKVGEIVLDSQGKLVLVPGRLAKPPTAPTLTVQGQTITVAWLQERDEADEKVIPTTGFTIKYCRRLNPDKDGVFPRASENEVAAEVSCNASNTKDTLSKSKPGSTPWDLYTPDNGNSKKTLFLGLTQIAQRECTDQRFQNQVAVRIVDVAPEFKPEIKAAPIEDSDNTVVAVFAGTSGHGKSTEINAFISYLLGQHIDDPARILVIDDRGAKQSDSVTQIMTCFCI
ncbi:hypothetical protein BDV38DRAFT_287428 [Aspergillus pseudotamarii]|uniref:Stonustoxin-like helical domain-containing protein n=1 Tax=Aspergillus pseudotamarii TaxID=132259 RepID=A0A5N6SDU7_ASPPS|nr:uncharacterized protein BDV38DRAFT_287428 [Aspergillus pseudotamarii]KAE8132832.1 hypothetical protein BDV38DRAFT_287428 [Aspergillus pseudotamarii]